MPGLYNVLEIIGIPNWLVDYQLLCGSITWVFQQLKALRSLLYSSKDTCPLLVHVDCVAA